MCSYRLSTEQDTVKMFYLNPYHMCHLIILIGIRCGAQQQVYMTMLSSRLFPSEEGAGSLQEGMRWDCE